MKLNLKNKALTIILPLIMASFALNAQNQPVVIDEIVGVVGSHPIFWSDVETNYMQAKAHSKDQQIKECDVFEYLMLQKLMIYQGEIDSVKVTDEQVENELERRLRYYIAQFGSKQKLEEFYDKSLSAFKDELREPLRLEIMAQMVQSQIVDNVKASPQETKEYFMNMPADSIPMIPAMYEIGQIVKIPKIGFLQQQEAREKLDDIKKRIRNGEKFSTLAILYSEDNGSATKGGELGYFGKGVMAPEFETAAFALNNKDDISEIIKTKFGYHILQLIGKQDDEVNVRHILIIPKVSHEDQLKHANLLDSVADLIRENKMTFEEAAIKFSDDPGKVNGGLIQSQFTGNTLLEASELDTKVFFVVDKLAVGEISNSVQYTTDDATQAYRLLYLKTRTTPHRAELDKDFNIIQQWALDKNREAEIAKWVGRKSKTAYIKISDKYKDCNLKYNWQIN